MAKRDAETETETDFEPAATPRGREEPLPGAPGDAPGKPAPADGIGAVIDRWFADRIKGGPIGRHTPSFNHLQAELEDLKQRLSNHLTRED